MRLNQTTDHAIRILLILTKSKAITTSGTLADKTNLTRRYLFRITSRLRDAGIISVSKGPEGGYALLKTPAEISVYDIIILMEGPLQLPDRVLLTGSDSPLDAAYNVFREFFEEFTKIITLDKLAFCSYADIQNYIREYVAEVKAKLV